MKCQDSGTKGAGRARPTPARYRFAGGRTAISYAATSAIFLSAATEVSATSYAPGANTSPVMNVATMGRPSTVDAARPLRVQIVSPPDHARTATVKFDRRVAGPGGSSNRNWIAWPSAGL